MTDILQKICDDKRAYIEEGKRFKPFSAMDEEARRLPPPRSFIGSLRAKRNANTIGVIAEIKGASPSAGDIRPDFSPGALAQAYSDAGAACLSVLTDTPYFKGTNMDLLEARASCPLPVLRKDFILDVWQVAEARGLGADCILLIMAALDDTTAAELHALATDYKMDVVIEVHNKAELDRALKLPGGLIGINNRDLKTLKTDLAITEQLAPLIPRDRITISESGIATPADIKRMQACGVNNFLVGESLLKQPDVEAALKALMLGA